jgi:hypothetical protein
MCHRRPGRGDTTQRRLRPDFGSPARYLASAPGPPGIPGGIAGCRPARPAWQHGRVDRPDTRTLWNANAPAWTEQSRAGLDFYRDLVNTPAFFAMLPPVEGPCCLDLRRGGQHPPAGRPGRPHRGARHRRVLHRGGRGAARGRDHRPPPTRRSPTPGSPRTSSSSGPASPPADPAPAPGETPLRRRSMCHRMRSHPCHGTSTRLVAGRGCPPARRAVPSGPGPPPGGPGPGAPALAPGPGRSLGRVEHPDHAVRVSVRPGAEHQRR